MKKFSLILLTVASVIFTSCNDSVLDLKEPIKPTLETYYTDTATAFNGLVGCYNSLQQVPRGEAPMLPFILLDIRSDDTDYAANPRGAAEEGNYLNAAGFANFDIYSDTPYSTQLYNYSYRGINTINKYLEGISTLILTASQQALVDGYKAEAKFIRAYFYFVLVKNFGPSVLYTKTLSNDEWYSQKRAPESDVYSQIFTDLREAIPVLPVKSKYPKTQLNRISKGAAQALLAKTLISQAELNASSPNWGEAYTICKDIETSGEYNLSTSFKDIWLTATQFNKESVFDIVFDESVSTEGDSYIHYLSPRFIFVNGVPSHADKMVYGFGLSGITEDLANQYGYNMNGDSLSYVNMNDQRGRYTFWARWDRYLGNSVVDKLNFRSETKNIATTDDANYYGRKYNREAPAAQYYVAGKNFKVIRYAEVLLLGAEAAYYDNKPVEALRMLNLVRERAFRDAIAGNRVTLDGIKKNSTGIALLEDIWQERRLELAGEGDRFYDLKRTHRLDILKTKKPDILFQKGKHEFLPIPSAELNKAPFVTQNPGY